MGLGKTLTMISLILKDKAANDPNTEGLSDDDDEYGVHRKCE